jgi:hypothetical protein
MVLRHTVHQFSAIGSGGVPPMPPTILMSASQLRSCFEQCILSQVKKSVMKVRVNIAKSKHSQWWLGMKVFQHNI